MKKGGIILQAEAGHHRQGPWGGYRELLLGKIRTNLPPLSEFEKRCKTLFDEQGCRRRSPREGRMREKAMKSKGGKLVRRDS